MNEYPYKKRVVAGDVPELKPYDYTRQLDSIARDMGNLSEQTSKIAQQNFLNSFELESRKAMAESYERNMNNPAQLEEEQNKIKTKFVSALPTKEMREQAKAQFDIHAMGYLGKAKENLYNQQFKELQASTFDRTNTVLNDIQGLGKDLYNPNLGISGTAANSIGMDIVSLEQMITQKDERGNRVVSPEREASFRAEIRKRLTASDLDHFDGLNTLADKEKFYKAYKDKKTKKIWLDPEDERGYSEQGMTENNTDWPTYERNLKAMERELEIMKKESLKDMSEQDKGNFAAEKIAVLERLDAVQRDLKNDAKYNPLKVVAFLQEVNDFGTNQATAFKGANGSFSYFLEPNEMYQYRKKVLDEYWDDTLEALTNQPDDTNFSYGMALLNTFFEKNKDFRGLNEYDRMEMLSDYYRQLAPTVPADAMQSRVSGSYRSAVREAAERAIEDFAASNKKFDTYSKNVILTTPKGMKTVFITEERPLPGRVLPNMKA